MWFIFAIIGALITGIGQVLVKKGQTILSPLLDNFLATIIVIFILVPALLLNGVDLSAGATVIFYALIAASMYSIFYYIINLGDISVMISLINTFPLVTILLALIYLAEWPNPFQWIGIIFVLLGIFCISKEENILRKNRNKSWIFWGIIGSFAIGVAEFVTKLATFKVDGFTFTFFVYLMYIPPLILFFLFDKKGRKFKALKNRKSLLYTLFGIFFIESGLIAIALAYQDGFASLVSPVVSSHMLITAILAVIFLKEKLKLIQKIGIILNLIGVSIIGVWS
jgi:drug/metabolite transporter (DMT)-like permease